MIADASMLNDYGTAVFGATTLGELEAAAHRTNEIKIAGRVT